MMLNLINFGYPFGYVFYLRVHRLPCASPVSPSPLPPPLHLLSSISLSLSPSHSFLFHPHRVRSKRRILRDRSVIPGVSTSTPNGSILSTLYIRYHPQLFCVKIVRIPKIFNSNPSSPFTYSVSIFFSLIPPPLFSLSPSLFHSK